MTRLVPSVLDLLKRSLPRERVGGIVSEYASFHADSVDTRKRHYTTMVNDYYNLVTDFYEFGWGQSFHFAPRYVGETFAASLARHEHYLALGLRLGAGMKVLDVGCGVGGPMREIARFSGCDIVGINNNEYQIERGRDHNRRARLEGRCDFIKADFMKMPIPDASFDAAYAIESTCHAPDKVGVYSEIRRALKPGALFAGYEWCLTDLYDGNNPEHRAIKKGIEEGDGLPDIWHSRDVLKALTAAGFEVLDSHDGAADSDSETPWYLPLSGQLTLSGLKHTPAGRFMTRQSVRIMETLGVAPAGSTQVSDLLNAAATALVAGGRTATFTPMFYFRARKPNS